MNVDETPAPPGLPRLEFPDGELDSWAVLGDVTDRSVRVWVRHPAGAVDASVWIEGEEVARSTIEPDPDHDHIGAVDLQVDPAQPQASFEVRVAGVVRHARFAPRPGAHAGFSFAFGSCHQPFIDKADDGRVERHDGAAIYPRIRELLVDSGAAFAMWLGDQVYSDAVSGMEVRQKLADEPSVTDAALVDTFRHLYRGFFNETGYRELAEAVPAYLMWDDHDIFDGWGSLIDRTSFDERVYSAAEMAFREYQHLRNPGGSFDSAPPFGYSFWRGDVGFHVLDLRGERDFEKGRIMGKAGWALLDEFLAEATDRQVPTVFLGASVPIVHASPALMAALERLKTSSGRDVRDRWSVPTFAAERTRILERIFAWQSAAPRRQVVVLSGDVHVGAAFGVERSDGRARFAQWTSSALSTPDGRKHVIANRVITRFVRRGEREVRVSRRGLVTGNNVGLVRVAPADGGGHAVSLGLYEHAARAGRLAVSLRDVCRPSG